MAGASLALASDLGWTLGLGDFTVGLRAEPALGPATYEFGFDLAPLIPDPGFVAAVKAVAIPDLPPSDLPDQVDALWGSVFLTLSAPLDRYASEAPPYLTRVEIKQLTFAWGQMAATASGLVEADGNGYAAGKVTVDITNWNRLPAVLVALGVVKPEVAPTVAQGDAGTGCADAGPHGPDADADACRWPDELWSLPAGPGAADGAALGLNPSGNKPRRIGRRCQSGKDPGVPTSGRDLDQCAQSCRWYHLVCQHRRFP